MTVQLDLSGPPRQRGQQHGEQLKDGIHELYDNFISLMASSDGGAVPVSEQAVLHYAKLHEPYIRDAAPDLFEELQGIAEGSNVDLGIILSLNCVAEVRRLKIAAINESVRAKGVDLEANAGCTCLGVQGSATLNGIFIAQTYDIEPLWKPVIFRIAAQNEDPAQVVIGHAGIICEMGLNADGIGFVASAIRVSDQRPGVPATVVGRMALKQIRLGGAVSAVRLARRTIGIHYLFASEFGMVDFESSATRDETRYVDEPILTYANHIKSQNLRDLELRGTGSSSYIREGRARQLLLAEHGHIGFDAIARTLRDETDYPTGICSHVCEGVSSCETRAAVIMHPASRSIWIAGGPPSEHSFIPVPVGTGS